MVAIHAQKRQQGEGKRNAAPLWFARRRVRHSQSPVAAASLPAQSKGPACHLSRGLLCKAVIQPVDPRSQPEAQGRNKRKESGASRLQSRFGENLFPRRGNFFSTTRGPVRGRPHNLCSIRANWFWHTNCQGR